jgi:protein-L-isoaspartate(D-aspartate) O-methyltransferase
MRHINDANVAVCRQQNRFHRGDVEVCGLEIRREGHDGSISRHNWQVRDDRPNNQRKFGRCGLRSQAFPQPIAYNTAVKQLTELNPLERMIQQQVVERGIRDDALLTALRAIPRDKFFRQEVRDEAYADQPAPIGHGQTISTLHIVALMTHRLELKPEHKVLELGTGSGYQTAVLSKLAGDVYSIERVKPLLDEAFNRLMDLGVRNVHFRLGDGTLGWAEQAPFDRIIITAAAPKLPEKLLRAQLKDGGIAVVPVGEPESQVLLHVRREGNELKPTEICHCAFVKLIGEEGFAQ